MSASRVVVVWKEDDMPALEHFVEMRLPLARTARVGRGDEPEFCEPVRIFFSLDQEDRLIRLNSQERRQPVEHPLNARETPNPLPARRRAALLEGLGVVADDLEQKVSYGILIVIPGHDLPDAVPPRTVRREQISHRQTQSADDVCGLASGKALQEGLAILALGDGEAILA